MDEVAAGGEPVGSTGNVQPVAGLVAVPARRNGLLGAHLGQVRIDAAPGDPAIERSDWQVEAGEAAPGV
ncbi:MAG: hypothetical protein U1E14_09855 [Geminicoccaceae bacterium]